MNKKTTTKKTATKARSTAKARVSATKTKKVTKATSKVASKTTQRKGIKHHAKRVYHMTPKFIHGAIAGAFVGIIVVASLGVTGGVYANPKADDCIKTDGPIKVNNANANVSIKLDKGCGKRSFVMKSYYAENANGGKDGASQVLYDVTNSPLTLTPQDPLTKIHVRMFDNACFYQVDLVDVTNNLPKNPIVRAAVGGNKDCRPVQTHRYACTSLGITPDENRNVTISSFNVSAVNATFTGATVNWGDVNSTSNIVNVPTAKDQTHQYAADGEYTIRVTAHFTYTGQFGGIHNVDAAPCDASISFTPHQVPLYVCEIATKKIITIEQSEYGSAQYPLDKYTKDLAQCVVTPPTPETPQTLANTGPGAVLIILGLATLGGYVFHMRHRHVQHRKHTKRHA